MSFVPVDLMMARVNKYSNTDTELFTELFYACEFILKITTAAFVASVENEHENHRYRLMHKLIRANGIGDWSSVLEEALIGPASQHLADALTHDRRLFSERVRKGEWQYDVVYDLQGVLVVRH